MAGRQDASATTTVTVPRVREATDGTGDSDPLVRLIEGWLADESGYDEETWPELMAALDRDRLSSRTLFVE